MAANIRIAAVGRPEKGRRAVRNRWVLGAIAATMVIPTSFGHAGSRSGGRCHLMKPTVRGTEGDDVLQGTSGDDVIAGLAGNDRIRGGKGSDSICGGRGHDVLDGGEGIDWLFPGAGRDVAAGGRDDLNVVSYVHSPSALRINLRTRTARGWGRDIIRNVHQVEGSRFGDVIIGNGAGNALMGLDGADIVRGKGGEDSLVGGTGNDSLSGGRGSDYAVFIDSRHGVRVNLAQGVARGEGADRLNGLEDVFGSPGNDLLVGNDEVNEFIGGVSGDDHIVGRRGNDVVFRYYGAGTVDAGDGRDKVFYAFPGAIDLTSGTATGTDFSDSLSGVEDIVGGGGRHVIVGNDVPNELAGGGGRDAIRGGRGDDVISGDGGDDLLAGGEGTDDIRGGGGEDTCVEGESVTSCEHALVGRRGADRVSSPTHNVPSWSWPCRPAVPLLVSKPSFRQTCFFGGF